MKGKAPGGPTSSDDGLSWGEAWRASPEEGARDLLVVEALLASAAAGGGTTACGGCGRAEHARVMFDVMP